MSNEKVWIEWDGFLNFLQKNRHLLPMPVTFSNESLDGLLKIDAELKRLREAIEILFIEWLQSPERGSGALPQLFETMDEDRRMELARRRSEWK